MWLLSKINNFEFKSRMTSLFNSVNDKKSLIRYCRRKYIADTNDEKEDERVMFFN